MIRDAAPYEQSPHVPAMKTIGTGDPGDRSVKKAASQRRQTSDKSLSPAVRRAIQQSSESVRAIARRYGVSPSTVQKWRKRTDVADLRYSARIENNRHISNTILRCILLFRFQTLLPLDDCYHALKLGIPYLTRATLYRCLRDFGAGSLHDIDDIPEQRALKRMPIGYFNICIDPIILRKDKVVKFGAYDWVSKIAFAKLMPDASLGSAARFLQELVLKYPFAHQIQSNNDSVFIDKFDNVRVAGMEPFDSFTCAAAILGLKHKIIPISQKFADIVASYPCSEFEFDRAKDFEDILVFMYDRYNEHCKLKSLGGKSPNQYVKSLQS